ncbi:methyltransferase domain-containing protein [Lysobacter panacisoli]|uniref:methyltransferase domain-containing protein n=1 Tax=Lysobacter panacisoli TaxID=1255263 RepID=UPI00131CD19B|nr:methyltransferase domain-containing protein [Lysobacter panacisoli]
MRLVRRFVFNERTANRLSRWLPYYRSSVNESAPGNIVASYVDALAQAGHGLNGLRVAEIGAGRTNAVAYGLAAAGASSVVAMEPFAPYDRELDHALMHRFDVAESTAARVARATGFDEIPDGSVDLLLSNSVLEHVTDLGTFFRDCRRVLSPDGVMLHQIDYRDHFFKYPYAFLTFRDDTWRRWLDPGDLPRWRLDDHLGALSAAGFDTSIVRSESLAQDFARVQDRLTERFAAMGERAAVSSAVLVARCSP